MNVIYNSGIHLFILGAKIAACFNEKAAKFVNGRKGLLNAIKAGYHPKGKVTWFHCASVGEFEQARPIIEMVKRERNDFQVLVTFFSPSGYEMRKNWEGADWVYYLPFDTPSAVSNFLDIVRPDVAVFIKYEFWSNILAALQKRGIPVFSVCSIFREGQIFFRWYGGMMRKTLGYFTEFLVQDEASVKRLSRIGITNVKVCGDTRFDRVHQICADRSGNDAVVAAFSEDADVWIAGSSWGDDERLISSAMSSVADTYKLILVPHEIDRPHIESIMKLFAGSGAVLYSECKALPGEIMAGKVRNARILVVDAMGILSVIYRYARFAYIGGGFNKSGIHNILEAAIYGMPVIFGPHFHKFREAVELVRRGGAFSVSEPSELAPLLSQWTSSSDARKKAAAICSAYISENLGATSRIFSEIYSF